MHLCRAVAAGHIFFRRCGGRQHRGVGARGWHSADDFRGDARRRDVTARIRAARPSHYLWPPGCSGRERRVRLAAIIGGLVTGPVMGLSSGCFVGLELIEGES